jgi:hypothetical protein
MEVANGKGNLGEIQHQRRCVDDVDVVEVLMDLVGLVNIWSVW